MSSGRLVPTAAPAWRCPVCGEAKSRPRFSGATAVTSGRISAESFRPSSERFGETAAELVACAGCGHASLGQPPPETELMTAYEDAADPVSLREEPGQVETAMRMLERIENLIPPGKVADLGCWTGSFLVAAQRRGWTGVGIEPSQWAAGRAHQRGVEARPGDILDNDLTPGAYRLVALCDVLEHLVEPKPALEAIRGLLAPGGGLFLTVPDAGSRTARLLGRRWWSVLPMHLQYFSRASLRLLLENTGYDVQWMSSHAKVFSARYYAERLGGYAPGLGRLGARVVDRAGLGSRLVAPDFRDRVAVLATPRLDREVLSAPSGSA